MKKKHYSAQELADLTGCKLLGDGSVIIHGANTLEEATPQEISFLANTRYVEMMKNSKAVAICVAPDEDLCGSKTYLVSDHPSKAFQIIAELFSSFGTKKSGFSGIHPTAIIHETATIASGVTIGPYVVIDENAEVGENSFIGAHSYIGIETKIGNDVTIYPNCSIRERCVLKDRVILQPGAIIGSCGFGYHPSKEGHHIKLEQLGMVILEEDVEIGANTTVDRARFKATIVRRGSKIDNLVQIAHNVEIGEHNVIAAQTGIAGSSKTGRGVMMGGQVGVLGHVEIGDYVLIASRGGISKKINKPGKYRGSPAMDIHEYHKQEVHVRRLSSYLERIKELENKLQALEEKLSS